VSSGTDGRQTADSETSWKANDFYKTCFIKIICLPTYQFGDRDNSDIFLKSPTVCLPSVPLDNGPMTHHTDGHHTTVHHPSAGHVHDTVC